MKDTRIIVVGCGFAGLLQGALLSSKAKVIMLEKDPHIGGLFYIIDNNGAPVYTGAHCIGGISERGIWKQCFDILGLKIEDYFQEIDNISISVKGNTYKLPIKLELLKDKLTKMFPEEKKIDEFFSLLFQYNKAFADNDSNGLKNMFCKLVNSIFDDLLSEYFASDLIKILLLSYIPAYAGIGLKGNAFTAVSLLITYSMGTAYVKNQSNDLLDKLKEIILENDGEFYFNSKVSKIIGKEKNYIVEYRNKKDQVCFQECEHVVLACYPHKLLSDSFPGTKTNSYLKGLKDGPSAIRLICKVKNDAGDDVTEIMSYGAYDFEEIENNLFFKKGMEHLPACMLSMPTLGDDSNKEYTYLMLTILTYQCDLDNSVKEYLLNLLKKDMPELFERVIDSYVFLPSYYKNKIGYDSGSVFGWERNRNTNLITNMFSPKIKDTPNIFIAGQWSSDFGIYGVVRNALMIYEIERGKL